MGSLREIIASILGVAADQIDENSSPRTLPQWDSAAHIDIVLSVEAEYGVNFTPEEMLDSLSVAAIRKTLERKGVTFA